jgi:hypothetical protein
LEEELTNKLERVQMTKPKGKQTNEQAMTNAKNKTFNAQLIGDPGIFTRK